MQIRHPIKTAMKNHKVNSSKRTAVATKYSGWFEFEFTANKLAGTVCNVLLLTAQQK
jgi:hypothetical protein